MLSIKLCDIIMLNKIIKKRKITMSTTWNDMTFSKKGPTDADLLEIEKDMADLNLDEEFIAKNQALTEAEIEERMKVFSKKELKMIDEMIRIMENPDYISSARKRRLDAVHEVEHDDEEIKSISFSENMSFGTIYDFDE